MTQFPLLHSREEDSSFQCMSAQWIQSGNYLNVSSADCSEELTIVCRKILFVKPVCSAGSSVKPVTKPRLETLMSAALNRANKLAIAHKKAEMKDMMRRLNQSGSFESLFAALWYSSMPCYDVRGITSLSKSTLTSMLIYCEWKGVQFLVLRSLCRFQLTRAFVALLTWMLLRNFTLKAGGWMLSSLNCLNCTLNFVYTGSNSSKFGSLLSKSSRQF